MKAFLAILLLLTLCTGCWDLKEINTLAIVSLAGVDKNKETGDYTAYYQVINPTGLSTQNNASTKASVYTYNFKDFSIGRFSDKTGKSMPRRFFTAHLQSYIISESYAKQGILDLLNFIELNPERRSNVAMFVSDSPLYTVMNSYTTLDTVPGRLIRSLSRLHMRNFSGSTYPIRFKDMAKNMKRQTPTVIPIIHYNGDAPASMTDRLEQIDATKNGLTFTDGAVFLHDRMVGRIDEQSKMLFFTLNKKNKHFMDTVKIDGQLVDVEAHNLQVKRSWNPSKTQLTFELQGHLLLLNNEQKRKMTVENLHQIETAFNQKLEKDLKTYEQLGKDKGWDLLGIQDNGGHPDTWRQTKITFHVHSTLTTIGNTVTPYQLE